MTSTPTRETALRRRVYTLTPELIALRSELTAARQQLAARELALGELRAQIVSFEGRYLRQVGILLKQLDQWRRKAAELKPNTQATEENFDDILEAPHHHITSSPSAADLKALFRELAKRIHPDRASDAADEAHRTRLMAQANDALLRHDANALRRMLAGFDAALDLSPEAELERTRDLLHQVRQDLVTIDAEHAAIHASDSAQLQQQAIAAAREGRDLLAEMAQRIRGAISLAMRQYELDLDRQRRPDRGMKVEDLLSAESRQPAAPRWDPKRHRWIK